MSEVRKVLVDDCPSLDAMALRQSFRDSGSDWSPSPWPPSDVKSIEHRLSSASDGSRVLMLRLRQDIGESEVQIPLTTTRPWFGGVRWWFRCPLSSAGISCGRRVRKLYLLDGQLGCRHCHGLAYPTPRCDPVVAEFVAWLGVGASEARRLRRIYSKVPGEIYG